MAFRSLRLVEDGFEIITEHAPWPKGNPVSQQAHQDLKEASYELNSISDALGE